VSFAFGLPGLVGEYFHTLSLHLASFFAPLLALSILSTCGLFTGRMIGWVASIVTNAVLSAVLLFTAGPLCILPVVSVLFLLSGRVKGFYLRNYYE
jgi:hypothetical protein